MVVCFAPRIKCPVINKWLANTKRKKKWQVPAAQVKLMVARMILYKTAVGEGEL